MTIFEVLAARHVEVDTAFHQIHTALARGDRDAASKEFQALSTSLLASMRAEHAIVYPAFAFYAGLHDEVHRAIREHDAIEQAINHIRLVPLAPEAWQGALTRLQLLVVDHVDTEEWILFPVARLRISSEQATKLASDFLAHQTFATPTTACSITYDYSPTTNTSIARSR
jgi:hypothetical protein